VWFDAMKNLLLQARSGFYRSLHVDDWKVPSFIRLATAFG
jgi:hypothetical protein